MNYARFKTIRVLSSSKQRCDIISQMSYHNIWVRTTDLKFSLISILYKIISQRRIHRHIIISISSVFSLNFFFRFLSHIVVLL